MTVGPESDFRVQSVSPEAAAGVLASTPLAPWAANFAGLALQYGLDLNWVLSYLRMETCFGLDEGCLPTGRHFSMDYNNPWDMLCFGPTSAECNCHTNGYCYRVYPTMEAGIQAGYENFTGYPARYGIQPTWHATLCMAVSGPNPCSEDWVSGVIAYARELEVRYPPVYPPPPPPPPSGLATVGLALGGLIVYAAYTVLRHPTWQGR